MRRNTLKCMVGMLTMLLTATVIAQKNEMVRVVKEEKENKVNIFIGQQLLILFQRKRKIYTVG